MAGKTLRFLEGALGNCAIVRSMPNTPAAIGRGITVAVPNAKVSAAQRALSHTLLSSVGAVEWVDDEGLIDAVDRRLRLGSGLRVPARRKPRARGRRRRPAGRPRGAACARDRRGLGRVAAPSPLDAATLRQNVTSPGGTTAAALAVLMAADGLDPLMEKAVAAATKRSRELAG